MFISNLIHQLVVAGIPIICRDDCLVIDAQAVRLHGVQETVQQSFRQIADQHELRAVVFPGIGRLGGLIAVKPSQISHRLIETGVGHLLHGDVQLAEDGAQS